MSFRGGTLYKCVCGNERRERDRETDAAHRACIGRSLIEAWLDTSLALGFGINKLGL